MIKVHCVVNNTAKRGSAYWGEHGVAFFIETPEGNILFDTGQSGDIFLHNAALLGLDLSTLDALALSHAHYDHTGGLPAVLPLCPPGIPVYGNADLLRERYEWRDGQSARAIGFPAAARAVLDERATLHLKNNPVELVHGVWTSGPITTRPYVEGRSEQHYVREGDDYIPDPYADDMSLVLVTAEGLVVVCGCCHAGLLNTLAHVHAHFSKQITAIIGGTHLVSAAEADLRQAAGAVRDIHGSPRVFPNHCSGERAYVALAQVLGDRVQPCHAGMTLTFES